jgi:ribonuclease HI
MADNVNLVRAILQQASTGETVGGAVLLVDFRKAYDTVDRDFLWLALENFGYPPSFIQLVTRLHRTTQARFLVNGELSKNFAVTSGIRQGCPLAPLLFLLAAETLKYAIEGCDQIEGVALQGLEQAHLHSLSAFVDDSAIFIRDVNMIDAVGDILRRFGAISGLQAQPHKSHAIVLDPSFTAARLGDFPVVPRGTTVPYLGIEIGLADLAAINWERRCAKLGRRLGALSQYATGVSDRVKIINLAGVSSVLFTAQFFPPSAAVQRGIDATWRQFIWDGTVSSAPRRAHKLDRRIMELPRDLGGMGLRDYRGATLAQAATAVLRWNSRQHDKYWDAFRVANFGAGHQISATAQTFPRSPPRPLSLRWTQPSGLWAAAVNAINRALTLHHAFPAALVSGRRALYAAWTAPWHSVQWQSSTTGRLRVPESVRPLLVAAQQATYAAMPAEIRSYWFTFPWRRNEWFRSEEGPSLSGSSYPMIQATSIDALKLRRVAPGFYEFTTPGPDPFRTRRSTLERLEEWLRLVLSNLPALPDDLPTANDRVYASGPHPVFDQYEWTWTTHGRLEGSRIDLKWPSFPARSQQAALGVQYRGWCKPVDFVAYSTDTRTCDDLTSLQRGADVVLAGHPRLQHGPTLLPALTSRPSTKSALCTVTTRLLQPTAAARRQGVQTLRDRLAAFRARYGPFGLALHATTWTALIDGPPGLSDYQRFFWYRLTLGVFNLRDNLGQAVACPHEFCASAQPLTMEHVLWTCPGAALFWEELFKGWCASTDDTAQAAADRRLDVFSRNPPRMAPHLLQLLQDQAAEYGSVLLASEHIWSVICTVACQHMWLRRNEAVFRAAQLPKTAFVRSTWKAVERQLEVLLIRSSRTERRGPPLPLFSDFWAALTRPSDGDLHPPLQVRLYFDGGARGNPGIAGGGCLLLERPDSESDWTLVWWLATYLGDNKTNNYAEHAALAAGVQECIARYSPQHIRLHIIGDSRLVLQQVIGTAKIKKRSLRRLADPTVQLLGQFPHLALFHTLRAGNTMADHLANHAMDSRCSTIASTTWTPTDAHLTAILPTDTHSALTPITRRPTSDLLQELDRNIARQQPHQHPD